MTTLIEPFIFNRVSADIKKYISKEQDNIASNGAMKGILDMKEVRTNQSLLWHLDFVSSLLSVRFNEHTSMNKAANLDITKEIIGYAALLGELEKRLPHLFEYQDGYIITDTEAGESYFESQAYQDIENIVNCFREHLQALGGEFAEAGEGQQSEIYHAVEEVLKPLQRYAHAKAGLAMDKYPDFRPKRDVDYSFV